MTETPRDVTDAELAVLEVLWESSPLLIRDLTEALYPGGGPSRYATVQKLLERLETKGCVARSREGRAHSFSPRVDREELLGRRLKALADRLCNGHLGPLLTTLVHQEPEVSVAEIEELRGLIQKLEARREEKSHE